MDRQFIYKLILTTAIGTLLIFISYQFIDKSVAEFAFNEKLNRFIFLKWLTYSAPLVVVIAFFSITISIFRFATHRKISFSEKALFVASCNTLITAQFKNVFKYLFGRTWPTTWINNNPSWLNNHVYGFHFFHGGAGYASFPSGHTTAIFTMISVLWFSIPRLRWLYSLFALAIIIGLLGMHYHFASDILAGALLGIISGALASRAFLTYSHS